MNILSPLGVEKGPSFETNFNPFHPRMLCADIVDIVPVAFMKSFSSLSIISLWRKVTLHFKKLYSLLPRMLLPCEVEFCPLVTEKVKRKLKVLNTQPERDVISNNSGELKRVLFGGHKIGNIIKSEN